MFRIRRLFDTVSPANAAAVAGVQDILRRQFPLLDEADVAKIPMLLRNPMKQRFKAILFVAENGRGRLLGFALLSHDPELHFGYLDYISAAPGTTGRGIGGALYGRVRAEALALGMAGIFFECLPDDPALCPDGAVRKQNAARLRFYEAFGARPLVGTAYETPVRPGDDNPPYLVFDDLGQGQPLGREQARAIVRAILRRKYAELCPRAYVELVVGSIVDDPVRLRPPRYRRRETLPKLPQARRSILLVVTDRHEIHHVRERGYVEAPVRVRAILSEIEPLGIFERRGPRDYPDRHLLAVHERGYVQYLKRACSLIGETKSVYPYVFPLRNQARPPKELALRAGYYCLDTFTPLNGYAWQAGRRAVDCALTAAESLLEGYRLAYALVRPPGHHAEYRAFGGFCYFNNAAVAAHFLSRYGAVVLLDIDYHHGNGQQVIFYQRADVLTLSLHGHPSFAYPYFSGFEDERGEGEGHGYNRNYPLAEHIRPEDYLAVLDRALQRLQRHKPVHLVVSLGLDTAKGDPTGSWDLLPAHFAEIGHHIGALKLPTLVVQEGGYRTRDIGRNARHFFTGLWQGATGG